MSLLSAVLDFIGWPGRRRGRKGPVASKRQVLGAKPLRHPGVEWETLENGEVVLRLPLAKAPMPALFERFFPRPSSKRIALDEVGGYVWSLCDGETSVEVICRKLSERYNLDRREAEASMLEYLRRLAKRSLVLARSEETGPEEGAKPAPPARKRRRKR